MEGNQDILKLASYIYNTEGGKDKLRLQKLLYISFGYYGVFNKGAYMFDEKIEAWKYGPVIPYVYNNFGSLKDIDPSDIDRIMVKNMDRVIKMYGHKRPFDLVKLTHEEGSPWSKTKLNDEIDKKEILSHYKIILGTVISLLSGNSRRTLEEFAKR